MAVTVIIPIFGRVIEVGHIAVGSSDLHGPKIWSNDEAREDKKEFKHKNKTNYMKVLGDI